MKTCSITKNVLCALGLSAGLLLSFPKVCYAELAIREVTETAEGNLRVLLETGDAAESCELSALVGTAPCEVQKAAQSGIRTWILIDASRSISTSEREALRHVLHDVLDSSEQEEIRFSTFGETIQTINDFSRDREAVGISIDSLEYADQTVYVYPTIAKAVRELCSLDRSGCHSRILLVTDGGEPSGSVETRESLREQLKTSGIPLYVLGCGQNRDALDGLSDLARDSGGAFQMLSGEAKEALTDGRGFLPSTERLSSWEVILPPELKNGSLLRLQLTVESGQGQETSGRDVRLPQRALPTATPTPEPTATPRPTPTVTVMPTATPVPTATLFLHSHGKWLAAGGAGLLGALLAGIAGLRIFWKKRNDKRFDERFDERLEERFVKRSDKRNEKICGMTFQESSQDRWENKPKEPESKRPEKGPEPEAEAQKPLQNAYVFAEETELLYGQKDEVRMVLTDTAKPSRIFTRVLSGRTTFGKERGSCAWVLDGDPSISRCHGAFYVRDGEVSVEDQHSTNGIWVNRRKVERRTRVYAGDSLRIGDSIFEVFLEGD